MRLPGQALQAGGQALAATAGPLQRTGRRAEGRSLQARTAIERAERTFQSLRRGLRRGREPGRRAVTLTWVRFNQALLLS
jgi:hypothetical protein